MPTLLELLLQMTDCVVSTDSKGGNPYRENKKKEERAQHYFGEGKKMKTNVSDTSRKAFNEIKYEGLIGKRQAQVLKVIEQASDYSLQELCVLAHLPVNVVSARVNELKEKNILEVRCKRKCKITLRTVNAVGIYLGQRALFH